MFRGESQIADCNFSRPLYNTTPSYLFESKTSLNFAITARETLAHVGLLKKRLREATFIVSLGIEETRGRIYKAMPDKDNPGEISIEDDSIYETNIQYFKNENNVLSFIRNKRNLKDKPKHIYNLAEVTEMYILGIHYVFIV